MQLNPTKRKFEDAVIKALKTLPPGTAQRVDGLIHEPVVAATRPIHFMRLRLWLMEKRGLIKSVKLRQFWPSCQGMKSYYLPSQ